MEQKDTLIVELKDKIDLLKKHISLLERFEDSIKNSKQSISQISREAPQINVRSNVEKSVVNNMRHKIMDPTVRQSVNICDQEVKQTSVTARTTDKIDGMLKTIGTDGATYSRNNQNQGRNHQRVPSGSGGHIIKGSRDDGKDFRGAERLAWLYVGNVDRNTRVEDIRKFLEGQFDNEIFLIEEIKKHETNLNKNKSFKVGFNFRILESVAQNEIWPRGVVVRRYNFFRYNKNKSTMN